MLLILHGLTESGWMLMTCMRKRMDDNCIRRKNPFCVLEE